MNHLSSDFVCQNPICLEARDCIELMIILAEKDRIGSLSDLLHMTTAAEQEYSRLRQFNNNKP